MRIMLFEEGKKVKVTEIGSDLKSLQETVGGFIEVPYMGDYLREHNILLVCNDEGMINESEPTLGIINNNGECNGCIFGSCFLVGSQGEDFVSLNDKQLEILNKLVKDEAVGYTDKADKGQKLIAGLFIPR